MIKLAEKLYRNYFPKQLPTQSGYQHILKGLSGLEIGGPSEMFSAKGLLPLYDWIQALDGCNFSTETVWEGKLVDGADFIYQNKQRKTGRQLVAEGSDLKRIADEQYDFIFSCHNLEHLANPIKALVEWKRILNKEGYVLLVLPHKDLTFDRLRPITTLDHLVEDYQQQITEADQTHFEEIIKLYDYSFNEVVTDPSFMAARLEDNLSNRCAHHHVFNTPLVAALLNETGWQIVQMDVMYHNIFALAQKRTNLEFNNAAFLDGSKVGYSKKSLFPSDIFLPAHVIGNLPYDPYPPLCHCSNL